jgi:hypothetical protein
LFFDRSIIVSEIAHTSFLLAQKKKKKQVRLSRLLEADVSSELGSMLDDSDDDAPPHNDPSKPTNKEVLFVIVWEMNSLNIVCV